MRDAAVERALAGESTDQPAAALAGPIVSVATGDPADESPLPDAPWVRVELPADVERLKVASPELAGRWQQHVRRVFTTYLNTRHARVAGVYSEAGTGRWFYTVDTVGPSGERS